VVIVLIWYASYRLGASQEVQLYVVAGAAVLLVWGAYAVLWLGQKNNGIGRMLKRFAPRTHLGHTKSWLRFEKWLDAPENKVQGLNEDSNKDKFVNK